MRNVRTQENQEEINNLLMKEYYLPSTVTPDFLGITKGNNPTLELMLKYFNHHDTLIHNDSVRLQGTLSLEYFNNGGNTLLPCEIEYATSEYLFITAMLQKNNDTHLEIRLF